MLRTESYKKGIVWSTGLNIFVKGILFLNTIVIAYFFGTNLDTDLYFYIFSTIILVAGLVNGMDLAVILPEGMHISESTGNEAAMRFYNFFGLVYLLIGIILFFVLFFFAVPIFSAVSSFNVKILERHKGLLMISSCLPLLIILTNYFTAVLTTLKYFTMPLFANGIAQGTALVSLVIFHEQYGISSILYGMVAGYVINLGFLVFFMFRKLHWSTAVSAGEVNKRIKHNLASVQAGNLATFAFNYGIILVLSSLPAGIYSAYNYSMQILNVPNNFIVAQAAAVAGIKFNELASKMQHADMNRIFLETTGFLLFMIIPFCMLTFLYAQVIVDFLYLRGGFTKESAGLTAYFLRYLIFLSPCLTVNTFIARIMTAGKKVSQTFFYQLGFNVGALIVIIVVTRYFGEAGFISSMLASYYFYIMIVCIFLFRQLMPYIQYPGVNRSLVLIFLYNLPFVGLFYILFEKQVSLPVFLFISGGYFLAIFMGNRFFSVNKTAGHYFDRVIRSARLKFN